MIQLAYKPHVADVLTRLRSLYERRAEDQIFAALEVPSAALEQFGRQYSAGYCGYPEVSERIEFWDGYLRERSSLEDDSIPSVYLSEFDQGLYGGLLGGDVQFMAHPENGWISSMVAPLLKDWSEFERLSFDRAHPWFSRYTAQMRAFAEASAGKYGLSHFILIDGLNFAFELVGATQTYLSLIEQPEIIHRAIDFAFDLNVQIQNTFFDLAPRLAGGTFSNMVQWIPGRIVSESVDPFHMTSVDYFEKWGREPVERIFRQFDGGVLHLHGNGRHLLEAVCSLPGLKAIYLGNDRGFPVAFDILGELKRRAGDMPLVTQVEFGKFQEALNDHRLVGGVLYRVDGVPDVATANRLAESVRAYRL